MKKLFFFLAFVMPLLSFTRQNSPVADQISRRWLLESLEFPGKKSTKVAPPEDMKANYMHFKADGTFESKDFDMMIRGKWRISEDNKRIINYDMDHPDLEGEIEFKIVSLSENALSITSKPMTGGEAIMHYRSL